jgi:hypothetical protein
LDAADSLSTIAAAGLGIAGFSGVMTANPWLFAAIAVGHVANTCLQVANAWRPEAATASGIYLAGLTWYLAHAAVQFSRMLFVQPADR